MTLLHAAIFVTGAASLALELLASRIMTPYFGVSLYIWTGVLSITLVSLAAGYGYGGRLAARAAADPAAATARLGRLYALLPAAAAGGVVAGCLVYPVAFPKLASANLVVGAFAGGVLLLLVPLIATSAMNSVLVAILRQRDAGAADGGAGRVFLVSTLGSVAGVLGTAFVLIPHVSNFTSMLVVAAALGGTAASLGGGRPRAGGAVAAAVALGLAAGADAYTGRLGPATFSGATWRVEVTESSLFGTVKILRSETRDDGSFARMYSHDGLTQNAVSSNGLSLTLFTYALEALAFAYQPEVKDVLVLGLGGGIVPMRFARRQLSVDVVEIDPASVRLAKEYFGLEPDQVRVFTADARTFVAACPRKYGVVVVDLFQGDATPEYLVTREFFADVRRCLAGGGVAVMNAIVDLERPAALAHLLVTLRTELPHVVTYRRVEPGETMGNVFVVAGPNPLPAADDVALTPIPHAIDDALTEMLAHPQPLDDALARGGTVISDARNAGAYDIAAVQLRHRRMVVKELPAVFLMN